MTTPPPAAAPPPPPPTVVKYGHAWPAEMTDFNIELAAFKLGLEPEDGGLGKEQHFKNIVGALWGKGSRKEFVFHPWAEKMVWAACRYKYLAIAGSGNSGKTEFGAIWCIVNFLADPIGTMVLVTSTSLKESRKRIWGSIREYWLAAPGLPGKLVDSHGLIRLDDGSGDSLYSEKSGITLIAGDQKKQKEAVGKLIGMKNKRVFLIADELSELSEAILEAGFGNLSHNPYFQLIGISNPASYYDPFGVLARPKAGYASINETSDEWETERGYALRFDAERSPNVLAGRTVYPFLPTKEKLDEAKQSFGEKSLMYFRMWRGFWCPLGSEQGVYTESDIVKHGADGTVVWHNNVVPCAALDPAFTNGGDRSVVALGQYGLTVDGVMALQFTRYEYLREDVTNKAEPRNFQIARLFLELLEREKIDLRHAAIDSTGGGGPFCDIVDHLAGRSDVHRVNFAGKASERPVSETNQKKSCDVYHNRMTELWYSGHEFMRSGQLKGISPLMAKEMTGRWMRTIKTAGNTKNCGEDKPTMKRRCGFSPDVADAGFVLLDLCRERLGAQAGSVPDVEQSFTPGKPWAAVVSKLRISVKTLIRRRVAYTR